MKKRYGLLQRVLMIGVTCILLTGAAPAYASGAEGAFPLLSRWVQEVEDGRPVKIDVAVTLDALLPFAEEALASLNSLVETLAGKLYYQNTGELIHTEMELSLGGNTIASFGERETEEGWQAYITGLDDLLLTAAKDSPFNLLLGVDGLAQVKDPLLPFADFDGMAEALPELLEELAPYEKAKKQSTTLKNVGKATKSMIYTLEKEDSEALKSFLIPLVRAGGWQAAETLLGSLVMETKGTLTAYYTAKDELIGLAYSGRLSFEGVDARKVTFQWAFSATEKKDIHTFSLKAPPVSGKNDLTITGSVNWNLENKKEGLTYTWNVSNKVDGKTVKTTFSAKLKNGKSEGAQTMTGEVSLAKEADKIIESWTLEPELVASEGAEVSLDGTVRYTHVYDKKTKENILLYLTAASAEEMLPFGGMDTPVDKLTQGEREALAVTAQERIAYDFLAAVLSLPQENIQFITKGLSEQDWNLIVQTFTATQ